MHKHLSSINLCNLLKAMFTTLRAGRLVHHSPMVTCVLGAGANARTNFFSTFKAYLAEIKMQISSNFVKLRKKQQVFREDTLIH